MDADHVGDLASAVDAARTLQALGSPLAQAGDELAPQLALRVGVMALSIVSWDTCRLGSAG